MNIFFPARLKVTGGSSTFARKFAAKLSTHNYRVFFTHPPHYDILFANATCPPQHLLHAKANRIPIIHRLDGVYYPMTDAAARWRYYNAPLWLTRRLATHVIYQSQYSRNSADTFLGRSRAPHTIIYNGVDTNRFAPKGRRVTLRDSVSQRLVITVSRFRRPDQIDPLVSAFRHYRDRYEQNSKIVIIGNFEGTVADRPQRYEKENGIEFHGVIPNEQLPGFLRAADVFLFTHLNPPCPNNVVEALACGLPICGVADGAMPELITPGQSGELVPADGDGFFQPRQLATEKIARNLHKIMQNRQAYSRHARETALSRFNLDQMVNQYLKVITSLIHS